MEAELISVNRSQGNSFLRAVAVGVVLTLASACASARKAPLPPEQGPRASTPSETMGPPEPYGPQPAPQVEPQASYGPEPIQIRPVVLVLGPG
ncbi:MAG: hypothetical protein NDJ90_07660, partial [Oligoflexia bacterium]|nr:hypothetical protein [Oligoflexia bacterium]